MGFPNNTNNTDYNSVTGYFTITSGDAITATSQDFTLVNNTQDTNPPDKNWMPYRHFEYEPLWHKKYAAIKYQIETMWN